MVSTHGRGCHDNREGHDGREDTQCSYCKRIVMLKKVVTFYMAFLIRQQISPNPK